MEKEGENENDDVAVATDVATTAAVVVVVEEEVEICVRQSGKTRNYIAFAERMISRGTTRLCISAEGRAATKAVKVTEVIKSKYPCTTGENRIYVSERSGKSCITLVLVVLG